MENTKIILDNGVETNVNGIFYIFDSKYYFIYTTGEIDDKNYVKLFVVQVCKEIKNTPTGPIDTGYMLGLEISNPEEWTKVQGSITKIVEDQKTGSKNPEIQYLPINMLVNLKVVSKNNFKLMKQIVEDNFNLKLELKESSGNVEINNNVGVNNLEQNIEGLNTTSINLEEINPVFPVNQNELVQPAQSIEGVQQLQPSEVIQSVQRLPGIGTDIQTSPNLIQNTVQNENTNSIDGTNDVADNTNSLNQNEIADINISSDVIIDYRTKFFEEQQKNETLESEIKELKEKLENIKNIIG